MQICAVILMFSGLFHDQKCTCDSALLRKLTVFPGFPSWWVVG